MNRLFGRIAGLLATRGAVLACLCLCLFGDYWLARMVLPNSDGLQSYNEMLAIRGGNLVLKHWALATDNFLLTDLPPQVLASLVLGTTTRLIYLVPFLVFAALLGACLLIVREVGLTRGGRYAGAYLVLLLLGLPYGLYYNFFFWSDFHVATVALCLYAVWLAGPALARRRFPRWRLIPFVSLAFAAAFSDPLADILLCGPLVMLVALRAWLAGRLSGDEALLAAAAVVAAGGGALAGWAVAQAGAYSTAASVGFGLVPTLGQALHSLHAVLGGVQLLATARAARIADLPLHRLIAASRAVTMLVVAALCLATAWQVPRRSREGVAQLLVLAGACLAAVAALSATFAATIGMGLDFPGAAVRFVLPAYVFLCLAAACRAGATLDDAGPAMRRASLALGLGLAALYGVGAAPAVRAAMAARPGIAAAPQRVLTDWLLAHKLTYGVGDYWDTQMVHAFSRGRIAVDPVTQSGGRLLLYPWLTDTSRFGYNIPPQFVVIRPGGLFHIGLDGIRATYGRPVRIVEVADFYFVAIMPVALTPR